MNNPYGISNLWQQGDFVTHTIVIILALMSVVSWYVMALKATQLLRLRKQARVAEEQFWHAHNLQQGMELLGPDRQQNPYRALTEDSASATAHHQQNKGDLHGALSLNEWLNSSIRRSLSNISARLQAGLAVLASVGSTAPFVGLFGTVWGIYHALIKIGISQQAGIDQIAGPVGEALIMTAFGLVVAIPAVLGYNALTRASKAEIARLDNFAHDLHAYFLTGARVEPQNIHIFNKKEAA